MSRGKENFDSFDEFVIKRNREIIDESGLSRILWDIKDQKLIDGKLSVRWSGFNTGIKLIKQMENSPDRYYLILHPYKEETNNELVLFEAVLSEDNQIFVVNARIGKNEYGEPLPSENIKNFVINKAKCCGDLIPIKTRI